MIVQMVSLVLDVIAGLVAGTCLLRLAMQAQRIAFNQPLGRFVFAMTDWIVMPLRKVIPPWSRWDLSSLVAAWLIKVLAVFAPLADGRRAWSAGPVAAGQSDRCVAAGGVSAQRARAGLCADVLDTVRFVLLSHGRPSGPALARSGAPHRAAHGGVDLAPLALLLVLQLAGMLLAGVQASWMY